MKEKNKKLFLLVGVLLLTFGTSLAFFIANVYQSGTGGRTVVTTVKLQNSTLKVEGTLEFNDTDVYPGHTVVSAIKVTATGDNELISYHLVWNGESGISGLNYTVYKTNSNIPITSSCEKKMEVVSGVQQYFEECELTNLDQLGNSLGTGSISKGDTKAILAEDEFITATSSGTEAYYYVVIEYPNLDMDQKDDKNETFTGEVTVEKSDKQADITILAFKVEQEDGSYIEQTEYPGEGYEFNQANSICTNGATPSWRDNGLLVNNYTKTGTSCSLVFDKKKTAEDTLAKLNITNVKSGTPTFTTVATGAETANNNGIFETDDPMYGEGAKTYYWRGAATTNHVIFANKCWRIVRINGDGTIRLIYNGAVLSNNNCKGNGVNAESLAKTSVAYNLVYSNSSYVGWTYTVGSQRPSTNVPQTNGTPSNIKTETEDWFNDNNNFTDFQRTQVVEGKFCNDRRTKNNELWRSTGSDQYYASYARLMEGTKKPTLDCADGDIYYLKSGAITADEVQFAGASSKTTNTSYYLYNGQFYWTMSPFWWNGAVGYPCVFYVEKTGYLNNSALENASRGIRPVINLNANVTFNSGSDGTQDNPYIVQ